jgi:hypothetical protein
MRSQLWLFLIQHQGLIADDSLFPYSFPNGFNDMDDLQKVGA